MNVKYPKQDTHMLNDRVVYPVVQCVPNTCFGCCDQILPQRNSLKIKQCKRIGDVPDVAQKHDIMVAVGVRAVMGFPTDD